MDYADNGLVALKSQQRDAATLRAQIDRAQRLSLQLWLHNHRALGDITCVRGPKTSAETPRSDRHRPESGVQRCNVTAGQLEIGLLRRNRLVRWVDA